MASTSSHAAGSFSSNLALGRSLAHRGSLQLLTQPPSAQGAFSLFLQAAQALSLAVRQAVGPVDKADVQRELKLALSKAEACKAVLKGKEPEGTVRRPVAKGWCAPESQELVLLQSAVVETPWGKVDLPFASPFLSAACALPNPALPTWAAEGGSYVPATGKGRLWRTGLEPEDVQQDRIANCSFVASVQVLVGWNGRHGRARGRDLLQPILTPTTNNTALYRLTIHQNGCPRTVHVDTLLPLTSAGTPLGISDAAAAVGESQDGWGLRLLEKGWMTLRGGWDSSGSNSSVDLHALIGWIPEVLNLRDSNFKREQVWTRLRTSFEKGSVLMTLGTGRLSKVQIRDTGLIARHDYSVLDLVEKDGKRLVRILNPWKRKARLRATGTARDALAAVRGPLDSIGEEDEGWSAELRSALEVVGDERVFSMPWEVVIQVFDAAYLNWDPDMFGTTVAVHSSWPKQSSGNHPSSFGLAAQPQFELRVREARSVWLLLQRHLTRIRTSDDPPSRDFIGIRVFESEGALGADGHEHTVLTDSALHLVKLAPTRPGSVYTVVLPRESDAHDEGRFSLTAFAAGPSALELSDSPPDLPYATQSKGVFLGRTAGGSPAWPSFIDNPMYELTIRSPAGGTTASLKVVLTVKPSSDRANERPAVGVNIKAIWRAGGRIVDLDAADMALDSGGYRREMAICSKSNLQPGTYTLIASAATPADEADFALDVQSTAPILLRPIPQEGAGLFSRTVNGSWTESTSFGSPTFGNYWRNPSSTLRIHKDADVLVRLCAASRPGSSAPPARLPLNVTIFASPTAAKPSSSSSSSVAAGPERATSGPYTDAVSGAAIGRFRLDRGEYRVVWSTYAPGLEGDYTLRVWADSVFDWERRPAP